MIYYGENNYPVYYGENEAVIYYGEEMIYPTTITGIKINGSVSFNKTGGTKNIRIASESDWEILTDTAATWITSISPSTGASGRSQIAITCGENTGTTALSTTITAMTTDSAYSATCIVTLHIFPNNQVQYTSPYITIPKSETIFYDASGNELSYTQTIDNNVVTMIFSGDLAKVYGSWFYTGYTGQMTDITLPASLTAVTGGIAFYGGGIVLEKFNGYSPLICDNGNLLYENTENTTIISAVKNLVGGAIVVPEGVTKLYGYSFWETKCSSISLPSTLTYIDSYCFENTVVNDMYCYALTPPSTGGSIFSFVSNNGTLHVPVGSNYSSFPKPSTWNLVYDL